MRRFAHAHIIILILLQKFSVFGDKRAQAARGESDRGTGRFLSQRADGRQVEPSLVR